MQRSAKGRSLTAPNAAAARRRTHRRVTAPTSETNLSGVLITDLTNASAIVTGGFGSATARRLARKDAKAVIADVCDERGEALGKEGSSGCSSRRRSGCRSLGYSGAKPLGVVAPVHYGVFADPELTEPFSMPRRLGKRRLSRCLTLCES